MTTVEAPPAAPPAPPAPSRWGRGGVVRRYAPVAVLALLLVVLAVVTTRNASTGLPFDPSSTEPDGTKALALILDRVGAEVTVLDSTEDLDVDTLLVLVDNAGEASADRVRAFVDGGGTALVADVDGLLGRDLRPAGRRSIGFFAPALPRRCDVPALEGVDRVRTGASPLYVVPAGAEGCFGEGDAAWLIIATQGDGILVMAGGPTFLVNSLIGEADNAALAAAILAPEPGTRVGILRPTFAAAGGEPTSLIDLIPGRLLGAALQATIAFGIVVLWRMRRLGKPVAEPQAVRLAGSELVVAMGNLLQRTGGRRRAAALLREDFRRGVAHRLGTPLDLPAEELATIAAERTGADHDEILAALRGEAPASDADLVALAQRLEAVREATASSVPAGVPRV